MGEVDYTLVKRTVGDVEAGRRQQEHLHEPLHDGGSGGTSGGMEDRVTRLETHMEYVRRDLDSISGKLDKLIDRTVDLPTKRDLWAWKWQWTGIMLAAFAVIVGSIIGGLGWIRPDPAPPLPQSVAVRIIH
jgi:hypothetical protein